MSMLGQNLMEDFKISLEIDRLDSEDEDYQKYQYWHSLKKTALWAIYTDLFIRITVYIFNPFHII